MDPFRDSSTYFHLLPRDIIRIIHQLIDAEQEYLLQQSLVKCHRCIAYYVQKRIWIQEYIPGSILPALLWIPIATILLYYIVANPSFDTILRYKIMIMCFLPLLPLVYTPYFIMEYYYRFQCKRLTYKYHSSK